MKLEEWLEFFRRYQASKILSFNHLLQLSGMDRAPLRTSLTRLVDRKVIRRICRGFYANPFNLPSPEEVSAEIYKPNYLSLEWALSRYGILSQIPRTLTCVTPRLPRRFKTPFGIVEYRQVGRKYFFGFRREKSYWMAEPEKALADFLYLNRRREIQGFVSELEFGALDPKKLKAYAKKMRVPLKGILK